MKGVYGVKEAACFGLLKTLSVIHPVVGISTVRLVNWTVFITDFDKIGTRCRNYLIPDLYKIGCSLLLKVKVFLVPVAHPFQVR